MKYLMLVSIMIVSLLAGGYWLTHRASAPSTAIPAQAALPIVTTAQVTIERKDPSYGSIINRVVGEATNNDSHIHDATLTATFFGPEHQILGTAYGAIEQLAPHETKTFELLTWQEIGDYSDMKIQIDHLN